MIDKYQEALHRLDENEYEEMYDEDGYYIGNDVRAGDINILKELVDKEAHKKSELDKDLTNDELKTFSLLLDKIRTKDCNCSLGCPLDCSFYCESNGNSDCALDKVENWCEGKKEEVGLNVIELD